MNFFQSMGAVVLLDLPTEEDAKRGRGGKLVLRYGPKRDKHKNSPRQMVNAVPMRIPSKLVKVFREYSVGNCVEVLGRFEGVLETSIGGGQFHSVQLVANTIRGVNFVEFGFRVVPEPHKGKPRPKPAPEPVTEEVAEPDDGDVDAEAEDAPAVA